MGSYSLRDVAAKIHLPRRTIIDWAEQGVVRPALIETSGSGTHRQYDDTNLLEFLIAKELLELGVPGRRTKVLLEAIRSKVGGEFWDKVGAIALARQRNGLFRVVRLSPGGQSSHWRRLGRRPLKMWNGEPPITFVVIDVDAARRRLAQA